MAEYTTPIGSCQESIHDLYDQGKSIAGSHPSQRLRSRRRKIDLIDRKLLSLLDQRLHIALEIGKIKKQMGTKIYSLKREKEILERLSPRNRGPLTEDDLKKIFVTIIKVCRQSQR